MVFTATWAESFFLLDIARNQATIIQFLVISALFFALLWFYSLIKSYCCTTQTGFSGLTGSRREILFDRGGGGKFTIVVKKQDMYNITDKKMSVLP